MTPTATARSRQRSAQQTRARILDAAQEAFVTRGYRTTSLREIAAAAGISHPGLLRHFSSKDELLAEVVERFEEENTRFYAEQADAAEPGALLFPELARRNAAIPGYLDLFAALTGEASTPAHPAHQRMRERYARLDALAADNIAAAIEHGIVADDRDPVAEAIRHSAGWDGLQLLTRYLPAKVDLVSILEAREDLWAFPVGWRDPEDPAPHDVPAAIPRLDALGEIEDADGYAVGRERRTRIVEDAMALFAREGYGDTSLREVAERVGVAKSTLMHHYPTKEDLLRAVLRERDRRISERVSRVAPARAADALRDLPVGAAENAAREAGLIEVYAVLSCEAVPSRHPAHDYFEKRFRRTVGHLTDLFRAARDDGDLPSHRDPAQEAIWLTALWDGLQYRWLYDRDAVDVAAHLRAHLDDVLPDPL
ncbi:TetR/AcrR family transcriptional regulator [Microbacterium sp.]|uniref:TetR/AcrR family transcriptional regulator n=1 Tax=Microbacterium sp. TaxID=51671 RepID=UPI00281198DD|nr:TetR/AcrR family transcriptional regulator [Microbacterium sp.]